LKKIGLGNKIIGSFFFLAVTCCSSHKAGFLDDFKEQKSINNFFLAFKKPTFTKNVFFSLAFFLVK